MSVQTINDVVSALDAIVQQSYDNASRPIGGDGLQIIQQAESKDVRLVIETLSQGSSATAAASSPS